jgi:drug/metabolite transporter (DMT)-like permease
MKLRIWAALLALYVVWGSTYLAIRFAVETMPPFLMAATRFLISGAILYAWRRAAGDAPPTKVELRSAAVVGLFLLLGGNGGVVWAEQRVPSGIAALLIGSVPLWMVLMDALRPASPRPNWQTVFGVLLGFGGIVLLVGSGQFVDGAQRFDLPGMGVLLLAALLWAIGSIYAREAKLPSSPLLATGVEMLMGGAGLLTMGALAGEWRHLDLAAIAPRSLYGLAYLIIFGSLVGFASYTWLLRVAPTPLVATYAYVNPLVAIFLGNLLAQEPITPRILLSASIIVGAVAMINTGRYRTASPGSTTVILPSSEDH